MKKGRPAVTLPVLAEAAARDHIAQLIFAETSTIGVRFHPSRGSSSSARSIEVRPASARFV